MSNDDQANCLKYLQGDVLGLKELSERLNQRCYEKFGVNLYKYLSTSQLINFLYSDTNENRYMEEEHISISTSLSAVNEKHT